MSDLVKRLHQTAYECDEQAGPSTWADIMRSAALYIEGLERLQRICGTARREALEEAARVAENTRSSDDVEKRARGWRTTGEVAAAAIRKLMEKGE